MKAELFVSSLIIGGAVHPADALHRIISISPAEAIQPELFAKSVK
jgi:hypothetical protein